MKTLLRLSVVLAISLPTYASPAEQARPSTSGAAPAAPSQTQKDIEAYLRNLYAFGPDVKVIVGPLKESPVAGLLETNIDVTIGENKQAVKFYVSKDGKFLFRGEL